MQENLAKDFIKASSAPSAAQFMFVKKKDESLQLCVDYQKLNEGILKLLYPLTLFEDKLMLLSKTR